MNKRPITYNLKPKTLPPLVVIVGETASGKSALAMALAAWFDGEIICADSWTVYRGFDIGTVKPTETDRQQVPHHLLDIADPLKGFSAAEFKRRAVAVIENITKRGKVPILVGGTGLYIDSVIFDYSFLPAGTLEQRQQLNQLSITELIKQIETEGIDTSDIDMRNKRRLIRLIETAGKRPKRSSLHPNTLIIGLEVPKHEIKDRITKRVDKMMRDGLEREVKALAKRYNWEVEPMKGIGYREFQDYFAGQQTLEQTRQHIIHSTLQLAKKQRTWFKRNKSIQWLANPQQALPIVQNFLSK